MKKIAVAICAVLLIPSSSIHAGKLDLAPEPALTVANGLYFPGGGWLYLSGKKGTEPDDAVVGIFFFVMTAATIGGGIYMATHKDTQGGAAFIGFSFLILRMGTITATEEAIKRNSKS